MKKTKVLALLLAVIMSVGGFSGCTTDGGSSQTDSGVVGTSEETSSEEVMSTEEGAGGEEDEVSNEEQGAEDSSPEENTDDLDTKVINRMESKAVKLPDGSDFELPGFKNSEMTYEESTTTYSTEQNNVELSVQLLTDLTPDNVLEKMSERVTNTLDPLTADEDYTELQVSDMQSNGTIVMQMLSYVKKSTNELFNQIYIMGNLTDTYSACVSILGRVNQDDSEAMYETATSFAAACIALGVDVRDDVAEQGEEAATAETESTPSDGDTEDSEAKPESSKVANPQ